MPVQLPENATGGLFFIYQTRWDKVGNKFALIGETRYWMREQRIKLHGKDGLEVRLLWLDYFQGFTGTMKYSGIEIRVQGR